MLQTRVIIFVATSDPPPGSAGFTLKKLDVPQNGAVIFGFPLNHLKKVRPQKSNASSGSGRQRTGHGRQGRSGVGVLGQGHHGLGEGVP